MQSEIIERFERAVQANGPRTRDDITEREYAAAKSALEAALSGTEPVAARYDFDGCGFQYIDNGSGSDWKTRHPDAEMLYDRPQQPAPSVAVKEPTERMLLAGSLVDWRKYADKKEAARDVWNTMRRNAEIPALSAQVQDDSEIVDCLSAGKPFVFDPATNFCHADDGGAPEHGIKYVPTAQVQDVAAEDVLSERKRQVEREGWTPEHDDAYTEYELAWAAITYAMAACADSAERAVMDQFGDHSATPGRINENWPWDWKWWKPKDRRRDLVRSAALIIAEIERLDRAAAPAKQEG